MSYIVLARKHRPQTFDEVVGQEHITTTLKNAITQNRVAHAYLFAGPRGIGKTSTARILAKALNCEKGPTPEPCNKCILCDEISTGRSLDILEIDGASNRGIDEIRNLRENVRFSPARGKFKIYIIDEVHMLTQEAFNALLKTLEEPPAHVKFVFATTAPHKLIPTILSRCQRFDFRRIPVQDIVVKLKEISKKEKFDVEEEALFTIAKSAEGSMRDAQSILDQVVSYCERKVTLSDVISILGMVEEETLFETADIIIAKDTGRGLKLIDRLMNEGKDLLQFLMGLMEHFRNLLVLKVGDDLAELIELPKDHIDKLINQCQHFSLEDLLYISTLLFNAYDSTRRSLSVRLPMEMLMTKLTHRDSVLSLNQILNKLESLEGNATLPQEESATKAPEPDFTNKSNLNVKLTNKPDSNVNSNVNLDQVKQRWPEIIERLKMEKISCGMYLEIGEPVLVEGRNLSINFPKKSTLHKESLERPENKRLIERLLKEVLGEEFRVVFGIDEAKELSPGEDLKVQESAEESPGTGKKPVSEPIVDTVLKVFKGEIKKIE